MGDKTPFRAGFTLSKRRTLTLPGRLLHLSANQADMDKITGITSVLQERRVFPPPKEFSRQAHIKSLAEYRKLYTDSIRSPERFWARQAKEELVWFKPWTKVLQWKVPFAKWFIGGKLNLSHNCLDKHLGTPTANKAALLWEGEPAADGKPGEERILTYRQLHREVCRFANVLKRNGLAKGDRAIIYLPMVPEAAIAMLACARIGAVHSVVFGGFSAQSVADRIFDSQAKMVITADGGFRRGPQWSAESVAGAGDSESVPAVHDAALQPRPAKPGDPRDLRRHGT